MSAVEPIAAGEVLSFLDGVRTTRSFERREVQDELVRRAVASGQRAPSTSNHQPYFVIDVRDGGLRRRVANAMVTQRFVHDAPVWLMICIDWSRQEEIARHLGIRRKLSREARRFVGLADASIFAHHVALALQARGLGVCFIASPWTALAAVAKLLHIPRRSAMPLHLLVAGYPAEQPPPRPRYPLDQILSTDRFARPRLARVRKYLDDGDAQLRRERYFERADTGVTSWHELYRVRYGEVARRRTWAPLRRDLGRFL
jgi:FMN reductase (NADPH)